jgi:hypothetical protein
VIIEIPTSVNVYKVLDEMWWNVVRNQQVLLYSTVNNNIAHIAV